MTKKFEELFLDAEAKKILSRFDRDRDGNLSRYEFEQLITPISNEYKWRPSFRDSHTSSFHYTGRNQQV